VPKKVNRIPGIKQLPEGKWQARLYHKGGEESRNFERREDAERWKRNLKSELDRCVEGVRRKDKKWIATFINESGVFTKSFNHIDSANKWVARAELAAEDGRPIDTDATRIKFSKYVETWKKSKIELSGKTIATYNSQLRLYLLPQFGERKLTSISTSDVRTWVGELSKKGVGATTIRQCYRLLHQILQSASIDELLGRNPALVIKLPKIVTKKKIGLTREQLFALANECGDHKPLVILMATCGLRVNEALALRVENFDLTSNALEVKQSWTTDEFGKKLRDENGDFTPGSTKTDEERSIPIPDVTLDLLRPLLENKSPKDWVFTGKSGGVLDYGHFRRAIFSPAARRLGLANVTPHTLRHTCASLLISLGAPITTVSYILGHASVKMTLDVYGHYYEDDTVLWMSNLDAQLNVKPRTGS
jgi:integrase